MGTPFEQAVTDYEQLITYEFTDTRYLAQALNASGNPIWFRGQPVESNKRLAVYGDAVLTARLCRKWITTSLTQGTWNSLRQSVLSNANLARVGQDLGLGPLIHCYAGTIVSLNMLATSVEAIVGAVHMDAGDEAVDRIMLAFGLSSNMLPQKHDVHRNSSTFIDIQLPLFYACRLPRDRCLRVEMGVPWGRPDSSLDEHTMLVALVDLRSSRELWGRPLDTLAITCTPRLVSRNDRLRGVRFDKKRKSDS